MIHYKAHTGLSTGINTTLPRYAAVKEMPEALSK
jgi:hypothetical protein